MDLYLQPSAIASVPGKQILRMTRRVFVKKHSSHLSACMEGHKRTGQRDLHGGVFSMMTSSESMLTSRTEISSELPCIEERGQESLCTFPWSASPR